MHGSLHLSSRRVRPPRQADAAAARSAAAAPSAARSAPSSRGSAGTALQRGHPTALRRVGVRPPLGHRPPLLPFAVATNPNVRAPPRRPSFRRRRFPAGAAEKELARRALNMEGVARRLTSRRSSAARPSSRSSRPRSSARGRPAVRRLRRRRVGHRQDRAARGARGARVRARGAGAARPLPRARWRADPYARSSPRCARSRATAQSSPPTSAATRNALGELLPELGGTRPGEADEEHRARQGRLSRRCRRRRSASAATRRAPHARGRPLGRLLDRRIHHLFPVCSAREEVLVCPHADRSDELHRCYPLRDLLAELERVAGVERIRARASSTATRSSSSSKASSREPVPAATLSTPCNGRSEGNVLDTVGAAGAASDDGPAAVGDAV